MPARGWIDVDELHCKSCELCVQACPKEVMSLDLSRLTLNGYHPVQLLAEGCTGCGICALVCPDAALTVHRVIEPRSVAA